MAKKISLNLHSISSIILLSIIPLTIPTLFLLHTYSPTSICTPLSSHRRPWSGDLRAADFPWNRLDFTAHTPPPISLRIAVFSRKWPTTTAPGGMERHAQTLHKALARRGHRVHIFTSPTDETKSPPPPPMSPILHWHDGDPNVWQHNKAYAQFVAENRSDPFDVVHTESVSLHHSLAARLPNLAVSWHGIAFESVQSSIYQDLARNPSEPMSNDFNRSIHVAIPKVLEEIRFFAKYAHHVAISNSCGEMLRDVYQIPSKRVHVIVNGVDEDEFTHDPKLGQQFRSKVGVPGNATLVLGTAGRLVRDKGHPLLYEAFAKLKTNNPNIYLIVAGSGPWQSRYKKLGPQVIVLGSMDPAQLRGFYNSIDVFVNPTLRPQGLDLTMMEGMMCGTPFMASRFPSIKGTIMVDDEFGFMFSPNVESLYEALELVAAEGAERLVERGAAGRVYAETMFNARKMALAYERLFLCIKNESFCMYPV
ncbi:hypothetical protein ABFS82_01G047600 [Erythranthe guttata]|uniref:Glycosyltransferase subfamily 4-like N-terminal domain-containing protein n=1 Tax=Erythranthe guttata TaxID=4155 RepID=A0A022RAX5_ERYGU|nr:hypothetical protein MIMGU_mgv1a005617mg [Erythranthe guttata]